MNLPLEEITGNYIPNLETSGRTLDFHAGKTCLCASSSSQACAELALLSQRTPDRDREAGASGRWLASL